MALEKANAKSRTITQGAVLNEIAPFLWGRNMTIIAYDGKTLLTDSACTGGDLNFGNTDKKHYMLSDGSIFVGAGSLEDIYLANRVPRERRLR